MINIINALISKTNEIIYSIFLLIIAPIIITIFLTRKVLIRWSPKLKEIKLNIKDG